MRRLLLLAAIIFSSLPLFAQETESPYKHQWHEIDSLIIEKSLPRTALQKVDSIYNDAKTKNNREEIIKALLYRLNLEAITEFDVNKRVASLKHEIATTGDRLSKSILQVMLARVFNYAYQENLWRNYNRTETVSYQDSDVTTWSGRELQRAADSLFDAALSAEETLKKTSTAEINAVLIKGDAPGTRPTVYDLLAHEALHQYKTALQYATKPSHGFQLNDVRALADDIQFVQYRFASQDSMSHILKTLQLFQQLTKFHLTDTDPTALIDLDMERIEWARMATFDEDEDSLYEAALKNITNRFTNEPAAAEAWYLLADLYATNAESYHPLRDTFNRYGYEKAKQLIEERLRAVPDSSFGNEQMKVLLKKITAPDLTTAAESVSVAGKPFKMLVSYANIDTIYARLLWQKEVNAARKKKDFNQWRDVPLLTAIKTFQQYLPQTNDHQQHAVEIKIDALPPGDYAILFSNSRSFSDDDKLALQTFSVSSLAYMRNGFDYFVVDRETGQPLQNVRVTGSVETVNSNKSVIKNVEALTDSLGHVRLPFDEKQVKYYSNVELTFRKGNDILNSYDNFFAYHYSNDNGDEDDSDYEDNNSQVYFFTDRSIYRPGQTVFYKGIVVTRDRDTKNYKLYHYADTIEVDLRDANGNTVDSMHVTLNDYGSFSGKFVLPANALTGEFTIETLDFNGETEFNVEEYKRPTFYVEFDTLKNSYRLGDTITVSGYAKAFAGNAIDNAKLTYHIERKATFPYSWLFWNRQRPFGSSEEIADSTIYVGSDGSFQIKFVAEADRSIDKTTEPVFDFKISVAVTDANGETREADNNVAVAYKALLLQLKVPDLAEVSKFGNIYVTTKNNAGENIPARVNIAISRLQTPSKVYSKRLWEQPDQFLMDQQTFEKYFPHDEYKNETDYQEWKKLNVVLKDTFNTAVTSNFKLPTSLLAQGWYCIEASALDKDGNEVKDVRYVQLYDMNAAGLPSPQTNFFHAGSNMGQPGEKAEMLLGTSEDSVFAVEKITKGYDIQGRLTVIRLNNNKEQISYIIQPDDKTNIGLYYGFIKHNRFYNGGMLVYAGSDAKKLNITYASYRNKTEPGSNETWSVRVTNDSNKNADAELLTSMYDASLDEFQKHSWDLPYFFESRYPVNNWDANDFEKNGSTENWKQIMTVPERRYDHLARSGYELWIRYRKEKIGATSYTSPKIFDDADAEKQIQLSTELQGQVAGVTVAAARRSGMLNEVVVTALGVSREAKALGYAVSIVNGQDITDTSFFHAKIRGIAGVSNVSEVMVIIDGVITTRKVEELNTAEIDHLTILRGSEAVALYGSKAANGAIVITTKEFALRNPRKKQEGTPPQIRKNFNETAFFFPHLHADSSGNYTFSFTMPEALTQWKWMSFAHNKDFSLGSRQQTIITQKTLMIQPHLPRFLREGDTMGITAKISNLSDTILKGTAFIQLVDALSNQPLTDLFILRTKELQFSAGPAQTSVVKFLLNIPPHFDKPLTIKVFATAGNFSDGEENTLPVLSKRMLVTETLPLFLQGGGTKTFRFEKLLKNHSSTLVNEGLTIEYTPDPVWYVVQSLPYLIQFPHECAEQTFDRFYANALAANILRQHPQIKKVVGHWLHDSIGVEKSQGPLQSNLEKNPELKEILLKETPWVIDAANESQQKKNIALLFDAGAISRGTEVALNQLKQMQLQDGSFAWFKGGKPDRYITQYILTGIGKLKTLDAVPLNAWDDLNDIAMSALRYLDKKAAEDYNDLVKHKSDLSKNHLDPFMIQYWYMRSFFADQNSAGIPANALKFFVQQVQNFWMDESPYMQAMIAMSLHRFHIPITQIQVNNTVSDIVRSLKENAVEDSTKGIHWKNNTAGYYWYESPIQAQAMLIDAFKEIVPNDAAIDGMDEWLIINKQTNSWGSTTATADACYALLNNIHTLEQNISADVRVGDSLINRTNKEDGTGYMKYRFNGRDIQSSMGNVAISVHDDAGKTISTPSFGAVYWQYFEEIDKITTASSTPLSLSKKLFIETNSSKGKVLQPVTEDHPLKVGDKVIIRLVLKTDRDMEYVHLKDMRAASMEPVNVLSEYKWQDGLGYYESTRDAATNFFIDHLAKGTYVFEYPVYVTHTGIFSVGTANIQCMYAPEFSAHSEGTRITVKQ